MKSGEWPAGGTRQLEGLRVTMSAPVPVKRDRNHLWYPEIMGFPDGRLAAILRLGGDTTGEDSAVICWSQDGGLTWGDTKIIRQSTARVLLPSGEYVLLPFHLFKRPGGMGADAATVDAEGHVRELAGAVEVTGLPREDAFVPVYPGNPQEMACLEASERLNHARFYFDGQTVRLKDGTYVAPMYGVWEGDTKYRAITVESRDALQWRFRSVIAEQNCGVKGCEGVCEPTLCRLPDGRLTCVFRVGAAYFGQCWSDDDGKTWTKPVTMDNVGAVEPRMVALKNGVVALSGGRPDLYAWFNRDGSGRSWRSVDLLQHHNDFRGNEPIIRTKDDRGRSNSAYTEVVAVDEKTLLCIYDRTPAHMVHENIWDARTWTPRAGDDPADLFSVWIVRISVEKR